jgi:hypothetical protein
MFLLVFWWTERVLLKRNRYRLVNYWIFKWLQMLRDRTCNRRCQPILQSAPNLALVPAHISVGSKFATNASPYLSRHKSGTGASRYTYESETTLAPISADIAVGTQFGTELSTGASQYLTRHRMWYLWKSISQLAPTLAQAAVVRLPSTSHESKKWLAGQLVTEWQVVSSPLAVFEWSRTVIAPGSPTMQQMELQAEHMVGALFHKTQCLLRGRVSKCSCNGGNRLSMCVTR